MGAFSSRPSVQNVGNVTEATAQNIDILSNGDVLFKNCGGKVLYILPKIQLFRILRKYEQALKGQDDE